MQIDIYFRGGLSNDFSGVYGISNIVIPLIKELKNQSYTINFVGDKYDVPAQHNPFVNLVLDKEVQSVEDDIIQSDKKGDILLVEMRSIEVRVEFDKVCKLIKDSNVPVLLWDTDLWSKDLPNNLKERVVLLRPYLHENKDFKRQHEFHYYTTPLMQEKLRCLDMLYIGNEYGRREKFDKFIGELSQQSDYNIFVGGNWLKKSKRDASLEFDKILYIGNVPHWACKPLFNHSKTTLQIVRKEYEVVGLQSHRIFEAATAGCVCFADREIYGIERFVPEELLVSSSNELKEKIAHVFKHLEYYQFICREKVREHTVKNRVEQLEEIIKEVY